MAKCRGLASSWELISSGSPDLSRSDGLRGSVEKYFFVTRSNFSCQCPRSFIKSPRSVVRRSLSFPLLRRPSTVVIQLPLSLPGCPSRSSATTDFQGSCFLNISSPLLRAHWSWRRHERWRPPKKIHHRFWFCCDPFFSWILLKSFRHCSRANCRLKWLMLNKHNKWFHSSRVKLLVVKMSEVGFWCRCIWFGSCNPD